MGVFSIKEINRCISRDVTARACKNYVSRIYYRQHYANFRTGSRSFRIPSPVIGVERNRGSVRDFVRAINSDNAAGSDS